MTVGVKYKYVVTFGGGLGPDIWDAEIVVEAENIKEGLDKAIEQLDEECTESYAIFVIEQMN